jgi:hypothetical protein
MIGICLQQMEVMPFHVCRHVFKFILGKPITWFDLAFYDPSMFDSLRSIVHNEAQFLCLTIIILSPFLQETNTPQDAHFYEQLQLTFSADIPGEEVKTKIPC